MTKNMTKSMTAGELRKLGMEIEGLVPDRATVDVKITMRFPKGEPRKMRYEYTLVSAFLWQNEWSENYECNSGFGPEFSENRDKTGDSNAI